MTLHESEIGRGSRIGRFVVVAELGSGGMGVVFVGHDPELDRQVALKVLRGGELVDPDDDEDRLRMLREGQAMARVTHPNVITVYEVGNIDGTVFLAQELLDGGTLGQWLEQPRPQREVIDKFIAAGRGLSAAHAAGLVHRDFKPDNVLLGKDGRVRVADFGLARAVGYEALAGATPRGGGSRYEAVPTPMSQHLTRTGAVMGTPMFMAPEQHNGERTDERCDQFAFCVALYHALYGAYPFDGKTSVALAEAVITGAIQPPPRGAQVPAHLRKVLLRGLATRPDDRYPSMDALLADLAREPARPLRTLAFAIGALVLVGGAGVAVVLATRKPASEPPPLEKPPAVVAPTHVKATERGTEWLTAAIDRGQFANEIEKYELLADGAGQNRAKAAIAQAGGAFLWVIRGDLDKAEKLLALADTNKGSDPLANAYADMARGAFASARGELATALERSKHCAADFAATVPALSAMCWEIHGGAAADLGQFKTARASFENGLAVARKFETVARENTLELALVQLDLDEGKDDQAAERATAVREAAEQRHALSPAVHAVIVLARVRAAQAASQDALALVEGVSSESLEPFRIRIAQQIAHGEGEGFNSDPTGLDRIEAARAEAEAHGFWGLVLEARLARVKVLEATAPDDVTEERRALIDEAKTRGYGRIARLAEPH